MTLNGVVIRRGTPELLIDSSVRDKERLGAEPATCTFEIESSLEADGLFTGEGVVYVTQYRMIIQKHPGDAYFSSLSIPFRNVSQLKFKKPLLGAHHIIGKVLPVRDGGFTGVITFLIKFKKSSKAKATFEMADSNLERSLTFPGDGHDAVGRMTTLPPHKALPGKFDRATAVSLVRGSVADDSKQAVEPEMIRAISQTGAGGRRPLPVDTATVIQSAAADGGDDAVDGAKGKQAPAKKAPIPEDKDTDVGLTKDFKTREASFFKEDARRVKGPVVRGAARVNFGALKRKRLIIDEESKPKRAAARRKAMGGGKSRAIQLGGAKDDADADVADGGRTTTTGTDDTVAAAASVGVGVSAMAASASAASGPAPAAAFGMGGGILPDAVEMTFEERPEGVPDVGPAPVPDVPDVGGIALHESDDSSVDSSAE